MTGLHDSRRCELGEGPLWHPGRKQLFWFDILGRRLLTQENGVPRDWHFPDMVSAAGWIDARRLMIASENGLHVFDLETGTCDLLAPIGQDRPDTRSNDGRADPMGGFWIGTMGKAAEPGAGAIWRWHRGEVRRLFEGVTIPNAIAFAPDGRRASFSDTTTGVVMQVGLDAEGWPEGTPVPMLDLAAEGLHPDGATFDADGRFWLAEWDAGRVSCYDGRRRVATVTVPAAQTTCPAFGGPDFGTLYITSAQEGMDPAARAAQPQAGMTFAAASGARGLPQHRVIL
jgi:sugar lactone lactonase YvrE